MTSFIIVAAVMALIAAAIVALPLIKGQRRGAAVLSSLIVAGVAAALYPAWSNWDWHAPVKEKPAVPPEALAMVAKLEQKMKDNPQDQQGWLLLGRSYVTLQRLSDAVVAYQHAYSLRQDGQSAVSLGEALSMAAGGQITPEAADLFEQGVKMAPTNEKALFYGGYSAALRGDKAAAKERWTALKNLHPPPQIEQMLDRQIASLDEPEGGTNASGAGTNSSTPPSEASQVTVKLGIAESMKGRLKEGAALFVFAREPGASGPPLAVKRLTTSAIGTEVTLSSADSMVPGRVLKAGQKVSITARVSFQGTPLPAAGDLFGEALIEVGRSGPLNLLIDRVAE